MRASSSPWTMHKPPEHADIQALNDELVWSGREDDAASPRLPVAASPYAPTAPAAGLAASPPWGNPFLYRA